MFGLPLLQHFVTAPTSSAAGREPWLDTLVVGALLVLTVLGLILLGADLWGRRSRGSGRSQRRSRRQRPPVAARSASKGGEAVLVDGSNVIYWQDNTPQLEPLLQVVQDLSRRGLKPGVVFDANVGYKLSGKFLGERDLSRLLSLPRDQILVVPKGTQADSFLLETARDLKAPIVTNDRFRDWVDRYPDVAQQGRLITGGIRDGQIWLKGLAAKEGAL